MSGDAFPGLQPPLSSQDLCLAIQQRVSMLASAPGDSGAQNQVRLSGLKVAEWKRFIWILTSADHLS